MFAEKYLRSLNASSLQDDEQHCQAEPLMAAALASVGLAGDLGSLLLRVRDAGSATRNAVRATVVREQASSQMAKAVQAKDLSWQASCRQALRGDVTALEAGSAHLADLLRLWTAEVMKRGRARRWVPENTAWDADAAQKLYRQVAEHSLAYFLDSTCEPCGGTGVAEKRACKCCSGSGKAPLTMAAGFVREHTLNMVSELHSIADAHAARASSKLRAAA